MGEDTDSRRLLRSAAEAASAAARASDPTVIGDDDYWRRDPRAWQDRGFLDTVQAEYGLVVRRWLVGLREIVFVGTAFWVVSLVLGFVIRERETVGLATLQVDVVWVAVGTAVLIRLLVGGVWVLVRRGRAG